ncbi:WD repeat and HMG-box DNA-binding protein 1 [Toxorhynchites rutilus septentrionalis]|uniref:WD repeat and HMG-box DNA-binding protein 1 n=1 Tax=Toxorhynchites rutilus septentrionalis TaxID=329112 RepID=UPI00247A5872|nr:WD repeat and HMG-box DNA-binding protein 1 [Toxorhynchites rutilus septentrionalis]
MPFKRSAMRYGHIVGYTSVAYQDDGKRILSIGHDGDIRIWDGVFDDDPHTTCVAENVWALLQYGNRVLIGNDLNTVQAYTYPALEKDGIDFRFTAFVTSIARNAKFIAAGSEDGSIKVKPVDGGEEFEFGGWVGPVLSISISAGNLLAARCGDGKLRVWDLNKKELLNTVEDLRKVKSFEGNAHIASSSFEPVRGNVLAYPKGGEIIIVNSSTWKQHKVLKHSKVCSDYTYCAFSPKGDYLAAGTESGEVVIWNYKSGEPMEGEMSSIDQYPVTGLCWNPTNNGELVMCDNQGQLGNVTCTSEDDDGEIDDGNDLMTMAEREATGVEDDDDDINEIYSKHVAGEKLLADDSDDENSFSVSKLKSQYTTNDDDLVNDLLGAAKRDETDSHHGADNDDAHSEASDRVDARSYPMQGHFQPGSTPDHLQHRYLVYNHVGIVRGHSDEKENSIEIEFHDSQKNHGFHLNNYLNHTMAGLSETVLAMACPSSADSKGSKLVCINFIAFGNKEWSSTMPGTEEIIGVVASDKIVVVATDSRLLRVFTARGTQREVVAIPGPFVSMAAFGDHILVAYHHSPASEDQHLKLMIITCVRFKLRCREITLALSAGAKLQWLGYSDKGSPVTYDSEGIMRLYHATANLWFPILNAEQHRIGASDSLFIIRVSESMQQAQLIVCRGAKYPLTNPRPVPLSVKFQQPMCDVESEKGTFEEELVRSIYLKCDEAEKILKETVTKLFAIACHSEMDQRAKELIETVGDSQVLQVVKKYANKINRFHLAESLEPMKNAFEEQEREEEKQELEIEREDAAMVRELQHINAEAITKKDATPEIKPLSMSKKGNPFRKKGSALKSTPSASNPLGHLTGKAIGFSSPSSTNGGYHDGNESANMSGASSMFTGDESGATANSENQSRGSNTPSGMKFMPWFEINRRQLKGENPDATDQELIKIGLKQYKALNSLPASRGETGEKRKLEDSEKSETGVSKLARFGFVKN